MVNLLGRTRLSKWYTACDDKEKHLMEKEVHRLAIMRDPKFTKFFEFNMGRDTFKIVFRRYAQLLFVFCIDVKENELYYFEAIHVFVQALDSYFGSVCELDLVHNFTAVYNLLDMFILAGEIQELSVERIVKRVQDDSRTVQESA